MNIDYTIIIPAYNEQEYLSKTLQALKQSMHAIDNMQGEIIVVDNNSTDKTAEIAKAHQAKVIFEPYNQISKARNAGAKAANGRYLIFLDADTILSAELLKIALSNLEAGNCSGGGVCIAPDRQLDKATQLLLNSWNKISIKRRLAAGCFIYCLREGYEASGGFNEKVYISEEIWFSKKLNAWGKSKGFDFKIIQSPMIVTSMRKLEWYSVFYLVFMGIFLMLFPVAVRFRSLCPSWYSRPNKS